MNRLLTRLTMITVLSCLHFANGAPQATPTRYVYDELNRLIRVERSNGVHVIYTYDSVGNRLTKRIIHDRDFDEVPDSTDNCPDTPNTDQANVDGDTAGDDCDCASTDPGLFAAPGEVTGLILAVDAETIYWDSAVPLTGPDTVHDIIRGSLLELPVGANPSDVCIGPGVTIDMIIDTTTPAIGEGFWYLIRATNFCGIGTYGKTSAGDTRNVAACP